MRRSPEGDSPRSRQLGRSSRICSTTPLLAAAYIATTLRLFRTGRGARAASALAPAGRMPPSNYLGQSPMVRPGRVDTTGLDRRGTTRVVTTP
ncbi:DUF418 domain-containing protein [Plantactinospora solaniradicis]|uniref:DUF418 domain-containing protein n=1 Tax=Plantactinospora solaniradicis TaxID=1723736 RepID=A0ABW1KKG3_9ACTN